MSNLTESEVYEAGIYQLETTDPVLGGESGISNLQAKQLANRTKFLKASLDAAKGSLDSLAERLAVVLNDDGTLKEGSDAEVVAARGSLDSLTERLAVMLNDDGSLRLAFAKLAADFSTGSTNYVSTGLSVTLNVGANGKAIVGITGSIGSSSSPASHASFFRINRDSGAEYKSIGYLDFPDDEPFPVVGEVEFTGLTPGNHTFLVELKSSTGSNVRIRALSLPDNEMLTLKAQAI